MVKATCVAVSAGFQFGVINLKAEQELRVSGLKIQFCDDLNFHESTMEWLCSLRQC